jgi:hypothetical protein
MIQVGIDLYGCYLDGRDWHALAGFNSGRKFPVIFAGLMLGRTELSGINLTFTSPGETAATHVFGEDGMTYYYDDPSLPPYGKFDANGNYLIIEQTDGPGEFALRGVRGWMDKTNGGPGDIVLWSCFDYGAPWGNPPESVVYEELNVDQWSPWNAAHDNPAKADAYRQSCTSRQWVGFAIALRMMGDVAVNAWRHNAFFDYVYRFMEQDDTNAKAAFDAVFAPQGLTYVRSQRSSGTDFIDAAWATYGRNHPPLRTN